MALILGSNKAFDPEILIYYRTGGIKRYLNRVQIDRLGQKSVSKLAAL